MRRTFADILNDAEVDVAAEYHSLHMLVFQRYGFYSDMEACFRRMPFAGTAYSLQDFNERSRLDFEQLEYSNNLDDLLLLCEYVYNFAMELIASSDCGSGRSFEVVRHIETLADKIGYRFVQDRDLWVLVPMNEKIVAAAEVAPEAAGNDLFRYDYRGYKGDLEGKRKILTSLARALESHRVELAKMAKDFTSDYFFLVNSLNIRHNNVEAADPGKYKEVVALMSTDELEEWYDTVRYMSAAAFLLLDYGGSSEDIKDLKPN